uniref:NADH-ubiquinone oxidoreductase chain 3 n=1 Tax=Mastigeulota kiangsinensis TaxID=1544384 RepID=A0A0U1V6A9_MASKI|nr:NADH dehydrogenase subunit 3 [Mastigeulota kiangsinensis]AIN75497.1 NADH dehydrogenase subunit 3 [Mastigeulota kiangsinensis]
MFLFLLVAAMLCGVLLTLYKFTGYYGSPYLIKSAPFECGFEAYCKMRRPFSVRYFILVVLFLIFDVEAVLLFPCLASLVMGFSLTMWINMYMFLLLLLFGLMYEWKNKMLDWTTSLSKLYKLLGS